jgi:phosphoserine phosphatase RsbU/P
VASIYLPARETTMVGGDFYDIWDVGGSWMVLIGDVTGKGVEAAALTALVRHTVRTASEFDRRPAELLALVDRTLKKRPGLSVCTAICLRLDGADVAGAVGGHPLPLRMDGEAVAEVGAHGPLLGAFPQASWSEFEIHLDGLSTLVAYTDGFTDARNEQGARFGLGRLCDTLAALRGRAATDTAAGLREQLDGFQTGAHADDVAAIVLRRVPDGEGTAARGRTTDAGRTGPLVARV